jgi:hypothetical protein
VKGRPKTRSRQGYFRDNSNMSPPIVDEVNVQQKRVIESVKVKPKDEGVLGMRAHVKQS